MRITWQSFQTIKADPGLPEYDEHELVQRPDDDAVIAGRHHDAVRLAPARGHDH